MKLVIKKKKDIEYILPFFTSKGKEDSSKITTILEALKYLHTHYNSDVSFRHSCESGQCGSCTVLVNGIPKLICKEKLEYYRNINITGSSNISNINIYLSPLTSFPTIKDLVVDIDFDWLKQKEVRLSDEEKGEDVKNLRRCIECFACLEVCPVFQVTKKKFSPISANKQLIRKVVGEAISSGLFYCTSCNKCNEVCPNNIEIFSKAVLRLRQLAPKETHAQHFAIRDRIINTKRATTYEASEGLINSTDSNINITDNILFFVGCMAETKNRIAEVGHKYINLLKQMGYNPIIPLEQVCCGSPLFRTGLTEDLNTLKNTNSDVLLEYSDNYSTKKVTTICPGCYSMLSSEYDQLKELSFLTPDKLNLRACTVKHSSVLYHNPCHYSKETNYRIVEQLKERFYKVSVNDHCCGAGGGCRSFNKETSLLIGESAVNNFPVSDKIVTSCPFCMLQLTELVGEEVYHFIEVL